MKQFLEYIKIQPLSWFEENCYEDEDGDFWKNVEDWEIYVDSTSGHQVTKNAKYFDIYYQGKIIKTDDPMFQRDGYQKYNHENWDWAVKEYISKEENPEYFI